MNIERNWIDARIFGAIIAHRINDVVRSLSAEVAALDPRFHLALRLGAGTPLAPQIRAASDGEVEVDDIEAQLGFVKDDLSDAPLLMAIKPRLTTDPARLVLRGTRALRLRLSSGREQPALKLAIVE